MVEACYLCKSPDAPISKVINEMRVGEQRLVRFCAVCWYCVSNDLMICGNSFYKPGEGFRDAEEEIRKISEEKGVS